MIRYPLDPPGLVERTRLWWTNKTYKWKFEMRRYGYVNFGLEKITRRFADIFIMSFRNEGMKSGNGI